MCQGRQEWYREHSQISGEPRTAFVASVTTATDVVVAADAIRSTLAFDVHARRACPTWTDALRMFIGQAEKAGILVMCSGVVYNNTHRPLDPSEFRGFAIADPLAPLVFLNGADAKAAQIFTLAHELGHVWLGTSGVTDAWPATVLRTDAESWCNCVAAELLVPAAMLDRDMLAQEAVDSAVRPLAREFRVSTLVVLRRLLDIQAISRKRFSAAYEKELGRLLSLGGSTGGNFYLSEGARVSKRFAAAPIESTVEDRRCTATRCTCSESRRSRRSRNSVAISAWRSDGIPARRECLHPGPQASFRIRYPDGSGAVGASRCANDDDLHARTGSRRV